MLFRTVASGDLSNGSATAKWSPFSTPRYLLPGTIASCRVNCPSWTGSKEFISIHVCCSAFDVFSLLLAATTEYVGTFGSGNAARNACRTPLPRLLNPVDKSPRHVLN